MARVSRRKRLSAPRKAERYRNNSKSKICQKPKEVPPNLSESADNPTEDEDRNERGTSPETCGVPTPTTCEVYMDHGYCSSSVTENILQDHGKDSGFDDPTVSFPSTSSQVPPDIKSSHNTGKHKVLPAESVPVIGSEVNVSSDHSLLSQVKIFLDLFLNQRWLVVVGDQCLHLLYYSIQDSLVVQRSLVVSLSGEVNAFVHNEPVSINLIVKKQPPPVPLEADSVNNFVDRIVSIVSEFRKLQVCSGYDEEKFQPAWSSCPLGYVDKNSFKECRFVETFRSHLCLRLVDQRTWRCSECRKMYGPLKRRASAMKEEVRHPHTANKCLSEKQMLDKMEKQHEDLRKANKTIYSLQKKMQELIEKEAVPVDKAFANDLCEIIDSTNLTPAQSIFMQQQVKASQQTKACAMRWHPTMIRFALSVYLTSPAAYEQMRQTGMIKLPSSSTLFDYSHAEKVAEGIDETVLKSVSDRVNRFKERHKKYHVLMADEIHISQNLVFQKSTGKIIGYTSLDTIDSEMENLEKCIDNPDHEKEETPATKILVFMIKGVSNGVKEVVATFTVGKRLSANQLYVWTWQVIGALERSGLAVIAYVSDGASVNRSFIKKHKPATKHPSGIIFDTVNKAAPDRVLYFIADVPHLLKTIRNCLLNSRWDGKKSRRKMMKNGKRISWDFIIKLYEEKKGKNLRKSYKLNPMNVYPDSYARMKVKLAGQPLSNTVFKDMQSQNWPDASETEIFINKVNVWFDCLNGAHSSQGKKTKNPNLNPYTSEHDPRFETLSDFLTYLDEWEEDVKNPNHSLNTTVGDNNVAAMPDCDESEIEDGGFNAEEDTPASRRQLSRQTLEGIKMTSLAFKPLVVYLLKEGVTFINARIFCQDPLEQHFSKIRSGQGGNNNPNVAAFLNRNRALHTIGQMGMRKRKGNSGEAGSHVNVTTEPLPKRKYIRVPKLLKEVN